MAGRRGRPCCRRLRERAILHHCLRRVASVLGRECVFQNLENPEARPSQPAWKIWSRFLTPAPPGTVPVDPIPVRPLTAAALDALDPAANHLVRLGHSSFLLKLRGKYWLIDPVFGERVSPFSFAGPKRFHPTPLALADLPPIEGLILSHDHYDHLDVPTIEYLREKVAALLRAARRGRAPAGDGRGRRSASRSSTGGKAAATPACSSPRRRRSTSPAAG